MSGFTAEWLALREPADWRARSARVLDAVARRLPDAKTIRAVDLGAGTGSNARFLARQLKVHQDWLLVDGNPELLALGRSRLGPQTRTQVTDLSRLETLETLVAGCDLVTASALLDLVSEAWLQGVCDLCRKHRAAVLFALSYDGRVECQPRDPYDERIRELVNRHQLTEKGFGPALGAEAAARTAACFNAAGYEVTRDRSDWALESDSTALQSELIAGWADAANDISSGERNAIEAWQGRRLGHVDRGISQIVVGHEDVGAFMA